MVRSNIDKAFIEFFNKKGALYIAQKLDHANTARVDRWVKEKKVPDAHRFKVYNLLRDEGIL